MTSLLRKVESCRQPEGSSCHWNADLLRESPRRKSCVRMCEGMIREEIL